MSSYQDVDWGYGNDAPVTEDPLPLSALDVHLARMGYRREVQDKYAPPQRLLHWEKAGANPISLAAPQYKADEYDNLVYDLHDIRDLLKHLNTDGVDTGGHELVATRRKRAK
jgi:hypothetical protein